MKENINLISRKTVSKRTFRRLFIISFISFISVFFFSFAMLAYILILQANLSSLEEHAKQIRSGITSISDKKNSMLIIKERLANISRILSQRKKIDTKVTEILNLFPADLDTNTIIATDDLISFKLGSKYLSVLDELANNKIPAFSKTSKINVKHVDFSGFGRTKSGTYTLSLDFYFNKSVLKK